MTNMTYDADNHMITSYINIYTNSTDAENNTNVLKQWFVSSSYDVDGNMSSYVVKEI